MFALIETNGATHIAINIPLEGADKSLPALAAMLEHNAVFIRNGWNDFSTVKAGMSIVLGNTYSVEHEGMELKVEADGYVIGSDFEIATPDVFVSNAKAIKSKNDEISRLRTELSFVKDELAKANERLAERAHPTA